MQPGVVFPPQTWTKLRLRHVQPAVATSKPVRAAVPVHGLRGQPRRLHRDGRAPCGLQGGPGQLVETAAQWAPRQRVLQRHLATLDDVIGFWRTYPASSPGPEEHRRPRRPGSAGAPPSLRHRHLRVKPGSSTSTGGGQGRRRAAQGGGERPQRPPDLDRTSRSGPTSSRSGSRPPSTRSPVTPDPAVSKDGSISIGRRPSRAACCRCTRSRRGSREGMAADRR